VDLESQKGRLRHEALALRDALPAAVRAAAAESIAVRPFPLKIERGAVVSGFSPMKSEINPVPLMRKLADAREPCVARHRRARQAIGNTRLEFRRTLDLRAVENP